MNWKKIVALQSSVLAIAGFLALTTTVSGCGGGDDKVAETAKPLLSVDVMQVDQRVSFGNKTPDGQYLIVKAEIKNLDNKEVLLLPSDFLLRNITDKEAERYTQPAEKYMGSPFTTVYGNDLRDKLVDTAPINSYPRLKLERYFVFMVPAEARPEQYQIYYKPFDLVVPLVSGKTTVHDNRYDQPAPQQPQ